MLSINTIAIAFFACFNFVASAVSNPVSEPASEGTFSPRQFCKNTGGMVIETLNSDEYICSYEKKYLVINTKKGTSQVNYSLPRAIAGFTR